MGEVDLVRREPTRSTPDGRAAKSRQIGIGEPPVAGHRSRFSSFGEALEGRRLFVLFPFAMIFGLLLYRVLSAEPEIWAVGFVGAVLALVVGRVWRSLSYLRVVLMLLAVWVGFSLPAAHGAWFGTPMLTRSAYGVFSARVDAVLPGSGPGQRVILSGIRPDADSRAVPMVRARLFVRNDRDLEIGDQITGKFRFYAIPGPAAPGGYDAQFNSYFKGIGAYGSTIGLLSAVKSADDGGVGAVISATRGGIAARVDQQLEGRAAAIARAVLVGDQSQIGDDLRDMMAAAGLAHVLAISGLHLSLVAGGVFFALRMGLALGGGLAQRVAIKKIAALGGILAGLGYLALSGGSVSAIRATIMLVLVFGAVLAGRQALTMRNVAIAGIIVMFLEPASVFRPSFQLSFAAVVALIGVFELGRSRRDRAGAPSFFWRVSAFVRGTAMTSLIAGLATALFAAFHFQQVAPLGVIGNVFALPLVGFVVLPAGFLSVLAMPFGFEGPLLGVMGWGIDLILEVAKVVSGWSWQGRVPLLTPAALVIGFFALAWFAFLGDRLRLIGPLLAVPAIVFFGVAAAPDILVSDNTKAVAAREGMQLTMLSGKAASFVVRVWAETYQLPITDPAVEMLCDPMGCMYHSASGYSVALVKASSAFAEDCWRADLVVTRLYAPTWCKDLVPVIDARALGKNGVHALRWSPDSETFDLRTAITDANRPWRP